ncbi:MAG: AraC family transcriptional regulator [Eubacteriales bacterium]|nr:AraC family transcriptional regulator [Eubacteriales bacterium]
MDWVKSFQNAIDYMEDHITEPLDYTRIGQEMHVSGFYFQKIFSILCGISPGEYIRNRRLTLAGSELLATDAKIIDIALKYGYDTPEGFTRAFTRFHGATPNAVRKQAIPLRSFSRLSISISVKGGSSMQYNIEQKEAFQILAKTQRFVKQEDILGRKDIPRFWADCHLDGTVAQLARMAKKDGVLRGGIVGMSTADTTVVKDFPYSIGAEYAGGAVPEGYALFDVPAATWAVFSADAGAPQHIQTLWHQIFTEFFPTSEYQPLGTYDLEVYTGGCAFGEVYSSEIWIAVSKK